MFTCVRAEIKNELKMGVHASPRSASHALPPATATARPLSAHTMAPLYTAHPHGPFPSSASAFAPARPMTAAELQPQFHPQQEIMCSFLRGLFSMLDSVFNAMAKSYDKRLKVGSLYGPPVISCLLGLHHIESCVAVWSRACGHQYHWPKRTQEAQRPFCACIVLCVSSVYCVLRSG